MKKIVKYFVPVLVVLIALAAAVSSFAQEQTDMLSVPSNTLGELGSAHATNSYFLEVTEPQVISLEVLTLNEGFSPSFAVYDSAGQALPVIADAMSSWGVDMKFTAPTAGLYRIIIGSLDSSFGSYLLRATKIGSYIGHEYNLALNAPVEAEISSNYQMHRYNFTAQSNQSLSLYISSTITNPNVRVSLTNQSRQQEAGAMDLPVPASIFCIPAGIDNYSFDLMSGAGLVEGNYRLMLVSNPTSNCEESLAFASVDFANKPFASAVSTDSTSGEAVVNNDTTTDCDIDVELELGQTEAEACVEIPSVTNGTSCTASSSNLVNVRALPTTNSNIIATVDASSSVEVLGYILDTSWVQVRLLDGSIGYMSVGVLNIASACVNVQIPSLTLGELGIEEAVINLDANVDLGEGEADVDVNVDLGEGELDVDANVDLGEGEADVDANVDLGEGEADVDANVDLGEGELDVDANINLDEDGIDVELEIEVPSLP